MMTAVQSLMSLVNSKRPSFSSKASSSFALDAGDNRWRNLVPAVSLDNVLLDTESESVCIVTM